MAMDHRELVAREAAIGLYDEPAPRSKKEISVITAFPLLLIPWFVYNVLAIPLAALGLLNPLIAAGAMALSDVTVIGNALLLRRAKIDPSDARQHGP